jgi:CheY-like chemotaxis protein
VCTDRDRKLLDVMVSTLRQDAHLVFQAADGHDALEMSLALRKVDLLITDTHIQGLTGPQLILQVRRELPDLPILYIENADEHGGPDGLPPDVPTLRDPFTAEDLLGTVRSLLNGESGSMEHADLELLEQIEKGGRVFRPRDNSDVSRTAFRVTVARLLSLRALGLVRLLDARLMRAADGAYLLAGPCDLTQTGVAALRYHRQLRPRPPVEG